MALSGLRAGYLTLVSEHRKWLEFQLSALGFTVIAGTARFFLAYLRTTALSTQQGI
jgi:hypothetical protein